ncbi:MAG: hypothetical protein RPU64_09955 [Candidatus Sedimenticola sp. (ex Thyasira tokunagai)]
MADFSKAPKKKNRFGTPPPVEEAGNNLDAPEHAPADQVAKKKARKKTGRTKVFSTRVGDNFDKEFRKIAFEDNLKFVELLEASLEAYKQQRKK